MTFSCGTWNVSQTFLLRLECGTLRDTNCWEHPPVLVSHCEPSRAFCTRGKSPAWNFKFDKEANIWQHTRVECSLCDRKTKTTFLCAKSTSSWILLVSTRIVSLLNGASWHRNRLISQWLTAPLRILGCEIYVRCRIYRHESSCDESSSMILYHPWPTWAQQDPLFGTNPLRLT